ncbi:MAG: ATP-binding cassette domain-containing protein [Eubacteriales bacterium]
MPGQKIRCFYPEKEVRTSAEHQKFLSITNLKNISPIAKSSIFQKEQLYVRANEDISLDIYEGETIGIVGESGCGKSTLGRVLLQLYDQTAGTTVYYGVPRAEVAPKYVLHTLRHVDKYISKLHAAQAHADALTKKADELGDNASFFDLQKKEPCHSRVSDGTGSYMKILGGFVVADTDAGAALLYKKALIEDAAAALSDKIRDIDLEISDIDAANDEKNAAKAAREARKSRFEAR